MTRIAFIGLGHMGLGMASNLVRAGYEVAGHDISPHAVQAFAEQGGIASADLRSALAGAQIVISVVRSASDVDALYCQPAGILESAERGALLVECSTIGPASARSVAAKAAAAGFEMLDAPVAGGQQGATAGRLTFMVGGSQSAFETVRPVLARMGQKIFHAGPVGSGQVVKLCNNLVACVSSAAVSEAFLLGKKLGVDHQTMYDILTQSTGQCWNMTNNCPVPGPVAHAPASNGYVPGFTTALMLKDLTLVTSAAEEVGAAIPLGGHMQSMYRQLVELGFGEKDWTVISVALEQGPRLD